MFGVKLSKSFILCINLHTLSLNSIHNHRVISKDYKMYIKAGKKLLLSVGFNQKAYILLNVPGACKNSNTAYKIIHLLLTF